MLTYPFTRSRPERVNRYLTAAQIAHICPYRRFTVWAGILSGADHGRALWGALCVLWPFAFPSWVKTVRARFARVPQKPFFGFLPVGTCWGFRPQSPAAFRQKIARCIYTRPACQFENQFNRSMRRSCAAAFSDPAGFGFSAFLARLIIRTLGASAVSCSSAFLFLHPKAIESMNAAPSKVSLSIKACS